MNAKSIIKTFLCLIIGLLLTEGSFAMAKKKPTSPHKPGEILIALKPDFDHSNRADLFRRYKATEASVIRKDDLYKIIVESHQLTKTLEKLRRDPHVRYAEPNLIMKTFKN